MCNKLKYRNKTVHSQVIWTDGKWRLKKHTYGPELRVEFKMERLKGKEWERVEGSRWSKRVEEMAKEISDKCKELREL